MSTKTKVTLLALASKYGVEVISFTPGNVTVRISTWKENQEKLFTLMNEIASDPHIYTITFNQGIVSIEYDHKVLENILKLNAWMDVLNNY